MITHLGLKDSSYTPQLLDLIPQFIPVERVELHEYLTPNRAAELLHLTPEEFMAMIAESKTHYAVVINNSYMMVHPASIARATARKNMRLIKRSLKKAP